MVAVSASRDNPFPDATAESVAVGVPSAIPVMANCAESVEVPPTRRSTVVFFGRMVPLN